MTTQTLSTPEVYQGQFGEFTINQSDRNGVIIYRVGLMIAALSFAIGSALVLFNNNASILTPLYACFSLALGVSLWTIHIYMAPLHRLLQIFWAIGSITSLILALSNSEPLAITVYNQPLTLFGVGFTFVALTGIYFKEAFCFNRLETKVLTLTVPLLLLGHLIGILPTAGEQTLLGIWAILFVVFAVRKAIQAIPPDIGDKSVFAYLKQQSSAKA
ncbi:DUF2301 domain-containing membrane protein [Halotia branconii]|uniref:DUF2301 domain-containing membrane protein n=1 Tax=Halotia branconii CENA392 TaxID=1539056 RepID=A0AAJ6NXP4_9CYAN|nr:DUF2301 domain-containing membrane protein [Halotia branconii]WGV28532.1 DUF2301 domain-containing membrane protein [Halotia branconii CENA392]